jgi:hypothetical protein
MRRLLSRTIGHHFGRSSHQKERNRYDETRAQELADSPMAPVRKQELLEKCCP